MFANKIIRRKYDEQISCKLINSTFIKRNTTKIARIKKKVKSKLAVFRLRVSYNFIYSEDIVNKIKYSKLH